MQCAASSGDDVHAAVLRGQGKLATARHELRRSNAADRVSAKVEAAHIVGANDVEHSLAVAKAHIHVFTNARTMGASQRFNDGDNEANTITTRHAQQTTTPQHTHTATSSNSVDATPRAPFHFKGTTRLTVLPVSDSCAHRCQRLRPATWAPMLRS